MSEERIKRKIIKKANLKTIKDTEEYIKKYLDKMKFSQLQAVENHIIEKIQNNKGDIIANNLFLVLVQEKLKKYEK